MINFQTGNLASRFDDTYLAMAFALSRIQKDECLKFVYGVVKHIVTVYNQLTESLESFSGLGQVRFRHVQTVHILNIEHSLNTRRMYCMEIFLSEFD
jgi:hypothetical protein